MSTKNPTTKHEIRTRKHHILTRKTRNIHKNVKQQQTRITPAALVHRCTATPPHLATHDAHLHRSLISPTPHHHTQTTTRTSSTATVRRPPPTPAGPRLHHTHPPICPPTPPSPTHHHLPPSRSAPSPPSAPHHKHHPTLHPPAPPAAARHPTQTTPSPAKSPRDPHSTSTAITTHPPADLFTRCQNVQDRALSADASPSHVISHVRHSRIKRETLRLGAALARGKTNLSSQQCSGLQSA